MTYEELLSYIIPFVIICMLCILLSSSFRAKKHKEFHASYPYKQKYLLTRTEYAFYKILQEECDRNNLLICPKVRMEDFLTITDKDNRMKYRGYVKSRHIDFLICNRKLYILCGIELDDRSHNTKEAQKTDQFKNNVFKAIGLPLFRVKVRNGGYRSEIRSILDSLE